VPHVQSASGGCRVPAPAAGQPGPAKTSMTAGSRGEGAASGDLPLPPRSRHWSIEQRRKLTTGQAQRLVVSSRRLVLRHPDVIFFGRLEVSVSQETLHGQRVVIRSTQMNVASRRPEAVCRQANANMLVRECGYL